MGGGDADLNPEREEREHTWILSTSHPPTILFLAKAVSGLDWYLSAVEATKAEVDWQRLEVTWKN